MHHYHFPFVFRYSFLLLLSSWLLMACHSSTPQLQEGDLLFKQDLTDEFSSAVAAATYSIDSFKFTHVGVAHCENQEWYVLEAISNGVCKTPLHNFLEAESVVVLARLKPPYRAAIPKAIEKIKRKVGKDYDHYFSAQNDAYYCSELVQQFYYLDNKPLFPLIKMTFKDKATGMFPDFWVAHFQALGCPIPEGEVGSNPGDLSKSDKLDIIGVLNHY